MDPVVAALRMLHVLSAAAWAGAGFFFLFVLNPALRRSSDADAATVLQALSLRSRLGLYMPLVSGLTVLAGGLLFWKPGVDGYDDGQMMGLNIGAGLAFLAFLFGAAAEGRTTKRIRDVASGIGAKGPTATQRTELASLAQRISRQTYVSMALVTPALLAMATFQYW